MFGIWSTLSLILYLGIAFMISFLLPKNYYKKKESLPLPPGPKPLPVLGCLVQMYRNKPTFRWILKLMEDMNTNIACIHLGNVHVITISCPELACEFLKTHDAVFATRPNFMSTHLLSDGHLTTIFAPFGEQWMKMRKVLSSELLSTARHRWLHEKRAEEADHLIRHVYNQCSRHGGAGGDVNVRFVAQNYVNNLMRKMMFGKRFFGRGMEDGGPGPEEEEHVHGIFTMLAYLYAFSASDYLPFLRWIVDLDGHENILRAAISSVRKYQDPVIDDRIQQWKHGTKQVQEDLLDVLINIEKPSLSAAEIKSQVLEIFLASGDNPSNALEWALAEMISQPELLHYAIEELDRVVGKNRLVQETDLPNLNYIKACAKEAFRLHPVGAFNPPHVSMSDTSVAGYMIPKGSHVLLSRIGLGRNPNVWEEPLVFKPERHLKDGREVVLADHELRILSFSTGRRGCPGITLGSTITGMLFARLLQGFTWHVPLAESTIDLTESHESLFMAKPLIALAKPRLAEHLYGAF